MFKTIGTKYEETKDLDIKDIAKLVRTDLKQAYPDYKFSVRIERFSMGQAINVEVFNTGVDNRWEDEGRALQQKLEKIIDAYSYDNSDPMTDYFHTRFYSHVYIKN